MIELIVSFVVGIIVGAGGLYALQYLYEWMDSLAYRVRNLRMTHARFTEDVNLWYEFNDWKRMQKGKE